MVIFACIDIADKVASLCITLFYCPGISDRAKRCARRTLRSHGL